MRPSWALSAGSSTRTRRQGWESPALGARIKQQMKNAFYTDTDEWKGKVLRQGREALFQAADGLAS